VSYSLTGWATIFREAIFPAASHILQIKSSSAPKKDHNESDFNADFGFIVTILYSAIKQ